MWRFLFKPFFKCASFNKIQLTKINPLGILFRKFPPPIVEGSQPSFPFNRFSKRRFPVFYLRFFWDGKVARQVSFNQLSLLGGCCYMSRFFLGGRRKRSPRIDENFKIQNLDWLNCLCCSILHFLSMTKNSSMAWEAWATWLPPKTLKMG